MKRLFLNNNKGEALISSAVLAAMVASISLNVSMALNKESIPKEHIFYESLSIEQNDVNNYTALDRKLEKIKNEIVKNDLSKISLDQFYIIDSVSDGKIQAIVSCSNDKNFDKAFENAESKIASTMLSKGIEPAWVKVDIIDTIGNISLSNLNKRIANAANSAFRYGIIFEDNGETVAILDSEMNANSIINYDDNVLSLNDLNIYLARRGYQRLKKLPDRFKAFKTISYFCDENDVVYPLYETGLGAGRRVIEELSVEEAKNVVKGASDYLVTQMQDNGKFVYGYAAAKDSVLSGYNNVRHSGTIWALVNGYDENAENSKECKEVIDKAVGYLISLTSKKSDDIYHFSYTKGKLCLGMDALSLVALSEYTAKFNDNAYLDVCKKIGNGIIDIQKEDGRFVHLLKDGTYEVEKEFQTAFYDGEAILGLCKLYGVSHDEKYLNAAKKAFDYCIDHNYLQYDDHWLEYSANEITKYVDDEKYYTFGLKNIAHGLEKMKNRKVTAHTDFEKLMQGYELYRRVIDKNISVDYLSEFPAEEFLEVLKLRSTFQLNSFCYPEVAMYLRNPQKYIGAFYIRTDNYRIRIDDVQHSMTGFYYYSKNF